MKSQIKVTVIDNKLCPESGKEGYTVAGGLKKTGSDSAEQAAQLQWTVLFGTKERV